MATTQAFSPDDLVVDRALAELAESFRFLLDLTPIDLDEAKVRFGRDGREPDFHYRELEDDPELVRRRLDAVPVAEVEDPTLATILRAKQRELELQLEMLTCRGSADFLGLSVELYGSVGPHLLAEAEVILDEIEPRPDPGPLLDAAAIVDRAEAELDRYRAVAPDLEAKVEVRHGTAGLMVSNGDLLVPPTARVPSSRIDALLHHEIGTHVVTHVNGAHQPLRILASGLAGHDETQEGLAVLAEHLVGGLTGSRLRQLAARVVAVHGLVERARFVDVHADLMARGVTSSQAFTITARAFRSGGMTKDAVYLRGLRDLVDHMRVEDESLEVLWLGKMPLHDVPLIADLRQRGLLHDPLLVPRYLELPEARARLGDIRRIGSLTALIEDRP